MITFGVTLALLTGIAQFVFHKVRATRPSACLTPAQCKRRPGPHIHRWGPFYCCLLAVPFVMADLTRHVLQDYGYIDLPMFNSNPHCNSPTMKCLSMAGWVRTFLSHRTDVLTCADLRGHIFVGRDTRLRLNCFLCSRPTTVT